MEHIKANLKRVMSKSKETERGEIMSYFRQRLNEDRVKDGYPPITMGRMGKMLEKIPTKDLYYLKRVCDDAKNFSKKFWWELKPKDEEPAKSETHNKAQGTQKKKRDGVHHQL